MRRNLIFLHYRAGSTLFQHLCRGEKTGFLSSLPPSRYQHTHLGDVAPLAKRSDIPTILTHIGNWWGNKPSGSVPAPYADPSPMKWSKYELDNYIPQAEWKFINLIRDPRNIIESLRNIPGGVEAEYMRNDPDDYFKALCAGYRNKCRIALDCQKAMPNYKIFKFENLMNDTITTMAGLFDYLDMDLDIELCGKRADDIKQRRVGKFHTSFKDDSRMNTRYTSWSEYEKNLFKEIAGKELIELGYEKDNRW